ncbi:MAG TPA: MFS transporter [Candidatus Dormibacteraeota bacterium]
MANTDPPSRRDLRLILAARLLRGAAFGMSAVAIGLHLERLHFSSLAIGTVITVAVLSAAIAGLAAAALAARVGRRTTLAIAGGLMALCGANLATQSEPWLIVIAVLTGMLGTGNIDFGAFASVEQASLAESAKPSQRNLGFARYSLTGGLAAAAGAAIATTATDLRHGRLLFAGYAGIGLITAGLALMLSRRAEGEVPTMPLSRHQIRRLAPLSGLFAVDAIGGGLVSNAIVAYWLHVRFGATTAVLGPAFTVIALLQSASQELSGRLANRIGLVRTMVFTHAPSNLLLALVPLSPSLSWAIGILFARYSLSQMDVPARQAYVVSIVPPGERAGAVAITGLVRGVGQAIGPLVAGAAIQGAALGLPFFLASGIKLTYDASLYGLFRNRHAEHERHFQK